MKFQGSPRTNTRNVYRGIPNKLNADWSKLLGDLSTGNKHKEVQIQLPSTGVYCTFFLNKFQIHSCNSCLSSPHKRTQLHQHQCTHTPHKSHDKRTASERLKISVEYWEVIELQPNAIRNIYRRLGVCDKSEVQNQDSYHVHHAEGDRQTDRPVKKDPHSVWCVRPPLLDS